MHTHTHITTHTHTHHHPLSTRRKKKRNHSYTQRRPLPRTLHVRSRHSSHEEEREKRHVLMVISPSPLCSILSIPFGPRLVLSVLTTARAAAMFAFCAASPLTRSFCPCSRTIINGRPNSSNASDDDILSLSPPLPSFLPLSPFSLSLFLSLSPFSLSRSLQPPLFPRSLSLAGF